MQGTNWVKVSEQSPKRGEFILFYASGETHVGWLLAEDCGFYSIKISKWFDYSDVSYWCDLPLPPMPEGEDNKIDDDYMSDHQCDSEY